MQTVLIWVSMRQPCHATSIKGNTLLLVHCAEVNLEKETKAPNSWHLLLMAAKRRARLVAQIPLTLLPGGQMAPSPFPDGGCGAKASDPRKGRKTRVSSDSHMMRLSEEKQTVLTVP